MLFLYNIEPKNHHVVRFLQETYAFMKHILLSFILKDSGKHFKHDQFSTL